MCSAPRSDNSAIVAQQQREAEEARRREEERQARATAAVGSVREAFARYDSPYFDNLRRAFVQSNADSLRQQQNREGEQALFGLARAGLQNSSAGNRQRGDLAVGQARQNNDLQQGAIDFEQQQRDRLFSAQQSLEAQARANGDQEGAAQAATAQAGNIARTPLPTTGSWVAPALTSVIGAYNNFQDARDAGYYNRLSAKLFGSGGGRNGVIGR